VGASVKIATLSFDDGGAGDLQVIPALDALKIKATFYLPSCAIQENFYGNLGKQTLQKVYANHEIGAHSRMHYSLKREPWANVRDEVLGCRDDLAHYFPGRKFDLYAYPYGEATDEARRLVALNYKFGRTCRRNDAREVGNPRDPSLMPITSIWPGCPFLHGSITGDGIPIHIAAHPWEIALGKWDVASLVEWIDGMLETGYTFLPNSEFFEETMGHAA
jgi:peptidoglycan/xylan/chitin deacetylase (PgdA/CDA1 family)